MCVEEDCGKSGGADSCTDDILLSAGKAAYDELHHTLNKNLGCAMERDWQHGSVKIKQPAMIDTLTKRFNVTAQSDTPASTVAD